MVNLQDPYVLCIHYIHTQNPIRLSFGHQLRQLKSSELDWLEWIELRDHKFAVVDPSL